MPVPPTFKTILLNKMWIKYFLLEVCLILSVQATFLATVSIELLTENDAVIFRGLRRDVRQMPESLVFKVTRNENGEKAILRLTKVSPLPTSALRSDGQHFLYHSREDMATYVDYSRKGVVLITKDPTSKNFYNLEGHLQIGLRLVHIKANEERSGHGIVRQETLRYQSTGKNQHRQKRSLKVYTIEVGFVADYENFYSFFERNDNDVELAEAEMRNYFAFIAEKLKVRYHHINEVDGTIAFDVVTSGLTIIEDRVQAAFSENIVKDGTVEARDMLNATLSWYSNPPNNIVLPPGDHYMFFTGYNLIHAENLGNAGLAYKGVVCRTQSILPISTSIVEDHRDGETGVTASHELGHALNASHDGDVGCRNSDAYIMSGTAVVIQSADKAQRPWQFSTCSVRDIKAFVQRSDVNCLDDNRYGTGVVTSSERPGQYFTVDEQCVMKYGNSSNFCSFPYVNDKDALCYLLWCTIGGGQCSSARVMEYTTCDVNRWCHRGLCIKANNTQPEFVDLPSTVEVTPTAQGVLLTVQTFDPDGDNLTFHILWDPPTAGDVVRFDVNRKQVSVRAGRSLATLSSNFSLIMSIDDGLLISLPVNVDFLVIDKANSPPAFSQNRYNITVNEGKAGSEVADLSVYVSDPDSDKSTFRFSIISKSFSSYFQITNLGIVTFAQDYDYDPIRLPGSLSLEVRVTDDTQLSATTTLAITILNVDQPSVFQNLPSTINIPEDTEPGGTIFNVGALDPDSADVLRYDFPNPGAFTSNFLSIDSITGNITLKRQLDYDDAAQKIYRIPIRVSTDHDEVTAMLTLILVNVNEPPKFKQSVYNLEVNNGPAGTIILQRLTGFVEDPDENDIITYRLETGDYSYLFNVNSTNGQITYAQDYGYDTSIFPREVSLKITATDSGRLSTSVLFNITVVIENEKPVIRNLPNSVRLPENAIPETLVFSVAFTDLNPEDTHSFALTSAQIGLAGNFTIDNNGNIRVSSVAALDFETFPSKIYLSVTVRDNRGAVSNPQTLTVTLINVNEAPVFNQTEYRFTVNEGKSGQVLVDTLLPYVTDQDANDTLRFSLVPSVYSLHFRVNPTNGSITFNGDYDADPKRLPGTVDINVIVRDAGLTIAEAKFIFVINNVNQRPRFTNLPKTLDLQSSALDNTVVYVVSVSDKDSEDVLLVTSDIEAGARQFFTFDPTAKSLTIINSAGIPSNMTFLIQFTVSDGVLSSAANLTINYIFIPETTTEANITRQTTTTTESTTEAHRLTFTDLPAAISISENFGTGVFYTVRTNARDKSKLSFTFKQLPENLPELFSIDEAGSVTVKPGVTLDYESLPPTVYLLVTADEDGLKSNPELLNISITDVNEPVKFNQTVFMFSVNQGEPGELLIDSLLPYLIDPDQDGTYTFELFRTNQSSQFKINRTSGALYFADDFDPSSIDTLVILNIIVSDGGNALAYANIRLNINKPPVFDNLPMTLEIPMTTTLSDVIYSVRVSDPNGENVSITLASYNYSGLSRMDALFVNKDNMVSVEGAPLPNANNRSAVLFFEATDGTFTTRSSLYIQFSADAATTPSTPPSSPPSSTIQGEFSTEISKQTTFSTAIVDTKASDSVNPDMSTTSSKETTTPAITKDGDSPDPEPLFNRPWVIAVLCVVGILIPSLVFLVVCVICRRTHQKDNTSQSEEIIDDMSQKSQVIRPAYHKGYFVNPGYVTENDVYLE